MKKLNFSITLLLCLLMAEISNISAQEETDDKAALGSHCSPEKTTDIDWYSSGKKAPKFKGLDGIDFKITTTNPEAQEYFNQGLMLSYGFNHAEAARSFYQAAMLDSACAMCLWGYAYVLGPNYNAGMEADNFERAYKASQKARALAVNATDVEKELIHALTYRYAENPPEDRSPLDVSYFEAMKKVYEKYPDIPDVGALYAESMMDLHPWDLYDKKTKQPREWTPEIISVLEHLIEINKEHPGAHHFYIHAVEASANPERGLESAGLLESLVPGAGHLVHMPSHIYINTGDYHLGTLSNKSAVNVDEEYVTACHAQGSYPLALFPHNYHFLAATATLEGNQSDAWMSAKKIRERTSVDIMKEPGWGTLQHYHSIPFYIAVKFAMWDTILAMPVPEKDLVYPLAVSHYARGMAWLGKNNVNRAETELADLNKLAADSILHTITIWDINSTYELMQIAVNVLEGEIAASKKMYEDAANFLMRAVEIEDNLNYDEPPDWFFSVRHNLGNVMLRAGKYVEAERIYKEDLQTWKKNGWALYGLYISLVNQGKISEAQQAKQQFENAWQFADYKLDDVFDILVTK
jgi:tetratricopeptide (TPR) repeat protein